MVVKIILSNASSGLNEVDIGESKRGQPAGLLWDRLEAGDHFPNFNSCCFTASLLADDSAGHPFFCCHLLPFDGSNQYSPALQTPAAALESCTGSN